MELQNAKMDLKRMTQRNAWLRKQAREQRSHGGSDMPDDLLDFDFDDDDDEMEVSHEETTEANKDFRGFRGRLHTIFKTAQSTH